MIMGQARSSQCTSTEDIHQMMVVLSVSRDYKAILYFKLLPKNQTINWYVYSQQLMKLDEIMKEKLTELASYKIAVFH